MHHVWSYLIFYMYLYTMDLWCFIHHLCPADVEQAVGPLGSDATSGSAESTQTPLNDGYVRGPIKSVLHRANSPNLLQ